MGMIASKSDYTQLICLMYRLSRYYEVHPSITQEDGKLIMYIEEPDTNKVYSISPHLRLLGLKEVLINYKSHQYRFEYSPS